MSGHFSRPSDLLTGQSSTKGNPSTSGEAIAPEANATFRNWWEQWVKRSRAVVVPAVEKSEPSGMSAQQ
jgi:hypothetical protein